MSKVDVSVDFREGGVDSASFSNTKLYGCEEALKNARYSFTKLSDVARMRVVAGANHPVSQREAVVKDSVICYNGRNYLSSFNAFAAIHRLDFSHGEAIRNSHCLEVPAGRSEIALDPSDEVGRFLFGDAFFDYATFLEDNLGIARISLYTPEKRGEAIYPIVIQSLYKLSSLEVFSEDSANYDSRVLRGIKGSFSSTRRIGLTLG